MKSALTVVLFWLFTIGVCVDGNEESVSVAEGDSVTLKSGVTEIQTDDEIEWWFSGSKIATISRDDGGISLSVKPDGSFRDRLQLNNQTGDLKISNIRDSGDYKLLITSPRDPPPEMTFTVKVVSADEVKSLSVMEGDSVTLQTGLTDIQRDAVIRWRFGQQKSLVAEINRKAGIFKTFDGPDERFRDRLHLNNQTGSLNITNITITDSGLYEVEISSTSSKHTIHKTFTVTVSDAVKSVSVKKGETVTLPITEIQKDDLILWMFGEIVLAEIHKAAQRFYISDVPDKSFRNRLQLDHQTGSLIITDTRTTDPEEYYLKISSSRHIINRRIIVTVGPGLSPGAIAGIVVGVLLGAAAVVVVGVIYYRRRSSRNVNRQNPTSNGAQDPGDHVNEGTELTNAS
uniref:Ig-like domain-containing protein n=1 Tax=Cyprinus carpio carpio TaxID=630221 RepID=A0A9J7ZGY6_CYPCA